MSLFIVFLFLEAPSGVAFYGDIMKNCGVMRRDTPVRKANTRAKGGS